MWFDMANTTGKKFGGRKKGTPNKTTTALKEAIMRAFDNVGGQAYLETVAVEDPKTFCTLLGKVLPSELNAKVEGNVTYLVRTGADNRPPVGILSVEREDIASTNDDVIH